VVGCGTPPTAIATPAPAAGAPQTAMFTLV
jgi:hypothetical protein